METLENLKGAFNKITREFYFNTTLKQLIPIVTKMIDFKGLPDSVNQRYFKTALFMTGHCALVKVYGTNSVNWYAVIGGRGGKPDPYYIPTIFTLANPALGSETIPLDSQNIAMFYLTSIDELTSYAGMGGGLSGLIVRTATLLSNIDFSIDTAVKKSRIVSIVTCENSTVKNRIDDIIKRIMNGEDVFTVNQDYTEDIKINPFLQGANIPEIIQQLVELRQFILAQFYHCLGVNSNYNLKRAQISNEEIKTNDDLLIVNTADIIAELQECCKLCNAKTGLNISVDYSEEWKKLQRSEETEETETEPNGGEQNEDIENGERVGDSKPTD
ncbi:MAG: hypothetical protein IJY79_09280 [Clostridia bacterium]|nr:hypothetical protein [Clostridia bacterium]MBQ8741723.1 hypothetical protein [Clostridia bacterium]